MSVRNKMLHLLNIMNSKKIPLLVLSCLIVHSVMLIIGVVTNVNALIGINMLSLIIYAVELLFLMDYELIVTYGSMIEVIIHASLCTLFFGNDFGYSLYYILLIPIAFNLFFMLGIQNYLRQANILSVVCFSLYILCYCVSQRITPLFRSESLMIQKPIIYVMNIVITMTIVIIFSMLCIIDVDKSLKLLGSKNKELKKMAETDQLTGLFNRNTISKRVEQTFDDYKSSNIPVSLIICDIDRFKLVNDTYGHDCGDKVLQMVANIISSSVSSDNYVCRWGGEEFLIVIHGVDLDNVISFIDNLRLKISSESILYNNDKINITMTFGIAYIDEVSNYSEFFKLADDRLYYGKENGRNRVVY